MKKHLLWSSIICASIVGSCSGPPVPAPTLDELKNATFAGLDRGTIEVTLENGVWEGKPFSKKGVSKPRVELVNDFIVTGDLDSNGTMEAIVLLVETTGGSGTFIYMAAAFKEEGRIVNPGTELLGDRIQVRNLRIDKGILFLDYVETAPFDPLCCPGQLVTKEWQLRPKGFSLKSLKSPGRLTLSIVGESEWSLSHWDQKEPVQPGTEITLTHKDDQLVGKSGCNRYFATVTEGPLAGDITVGTPGSTRMACPDSVMALETRFLTSLGAAGKFGFLNGRLAISFGPDTSHTLLFEKRAPPQQDTGS